MDVADAEEESSEGDEDELGVVEGREFGDREGDVPADLAEPEQTDPREEVVEGMIAGLAAADVDLGGEPLGEVPGSGASSSHDLPPMPPPP